MSSKADKLNINNVFLFVLPYFKSSIAYMPRGHYLGGVTYLEI